MNNGKKNKNTTNLKKKKFVKRKKSQKNLRKQATIKCHLEVSQLGTKDHLNYSFKMTFHLRSESIPCGASKLSIYLV